MIKLYFLLLSIAFSTSLLAQSSKDIKDIKEPISATAATEQAAVYEALELYIQGRNQGISSKLKQAFHPNSDLRSARKDTLNIWKAKDYINGVKEGKQQNCTAKIVYVDIEGNAAQAKLEIDYPNLRFVDYLNLLKIAGRWQIAVKSYTRLRPSSKKVLFVITSHEKMGTSERKTGLHLGEVANVYQPLHQAGYDIDFVSPQGGQTYMYGVNPNDPVDLWMLQNATAYYKLTHAYTPKEIDPTQYAAIYFVGGHGTMWDLPNHKEIQQLATSIYEQNGTIAAVCHGPSALLNLQLSNGNYLIAGKKVTGFTNKEEAAIKKTEQVPFLLESELKRRGAIFSNTNNWEAHTVVDGRLITGQNPASAPQLALELLKQLEN